MSYTSERVNPDFYQLTLRDQLIYLMHLASYLYVLPAVKDKCVLDFGCGDGYGEQILSPQAGSVTAVDISAEAIKSAKEKYPLNNVSFQVIDPVEKARLPFADQSFDCVISFQVIEHVPDYHLYVDEILRVLRPGGKLFLSTPNAQIRLLPFQNPWNRFHLYEFNVFTMGALLETKFGKVEIRGLTLKAPWLQMEKKRTDFFKWILWPVTNKLIPQKLRVTLLGLIWNIQELLKGKARPDNNRGDLPDQDSALIQLENCAEAPNLFVVCEKPACS